MKYVEVPIREAQTLEHIKRLSKKGHSAEVKYDRRNDKWVVYEVDKKKTER